jgi:endonuclease/exonuclease/phosphatase family metal-dependent hydrolase
MSSRTWRVLVLALASVLTTRAACRSCREPAPPIRFATFNIEDWPRHAEQIDGAFAEIAGLDAGFVAVQEIYEPARFAREARSHLGVAWELVETDTAPLDTAGPHRSHHLGVLFDRRRWTAVSSTVHDETRVGGRHKPTLEVRLRATTGDQVVRVLVVHLKAGADGREIRARQYAALETIVRRVQRAGEPVVLLGDFNATDDTADRADLARLAAATRLTWATEPLACSAFWDRDDGCFRSRLDHVLTTGAPTDVAAAGACATDGCERQDSCPRYVEQVSDHCPVVVTTAP